MKASSIYILIASYAMLSCNNPSKKQDNESMEVIKSENTLESNNPDDLGLNHGAKWLVNEEMKPYIVESERILLEYLQNNTGDYKSLASQLSEKNTGLIKSCTMTGESHEELHKWLHPHMELISSLTEAKDSSEANKILNRLKESFETFKQYFE